MWDPEQYKYICRHFSSNDLNIIYKSIPITIIFFNSLIRFPSYNSSLCLTCCEYEKTLYTEHRSSLVKWLQAKMQQGPINLTHPIGLIYLIRSRSQSTCKKSTLSTSLHRTHIRSKQAEPKQQTGEQAHCRHMSYDKQARDLGPYIRAAEVSERGAIRGSLFSLARFMHPYLGSLFRQSPRVPLCTYASERRCVRRYAGRFPSAASITNLNGSAQDNNPPVPWCS